MQEMLFYQAIYQDKSVFRIWKKLENGCYIGTLGYSPENAEVLMKLLKSFEEQYGEEIDLKAAKEELELYQKRGKLFIYFDENMKPVSMNGTIYDEGNISVDFVKNNGNNPHSLYFYGLSTLHEFRGKGACTELVKFAIKYAYFNNFDLVYARTDLANSNSEHIMQKAGLEICTIGDKIIAEKVDVTDVIWDYRLHMWLPLKTDLELLPKKDAYYANIDTREIEELNEEDAFGGAKRNIDYIDIDSNGLELAFSLARVLK